MVCLAAARRLLWEGKLLFIDEVTATPQFSIARLRSGHLLEQSLSFSKPRPLDPLPVARQRAFLLQELPQPLVRFLASVLRFQEDRIRIQRLRSIGMLYDLCEERRGFPFPSRRCVSLR